MTNESPHKEENIDIRLLTKRIENIVKAIKQEEKLSSIHIETLELTLKQLLSHPERYDVEQEHEDYDDTIEVRGRIPGIGTIVFGGQTLRWPFEIEIEPENGRLRITIIDCGADNDEDNAMQARLAGLLNIYTELGTHSSLLEQDAYLFNFDEKQDGRAE